MILFHQGISSSFAKFVIPFLLYLYICYTDFCSTVRRAVGRLHAPSGAVAASLLRMTRAAVRLYSAAPNSPHCFSSQIIRAATSAGLTPEMRLA